MEVPREDLSLPCLEASQNPNNPHEWSLGFSSRFLCPSDSPSRQGVMCPTFRTPGLGPPVCGLTHSLPRMSVHMCDLLFPLSPFPGAQVPTQCFFSHPTLLCLYLSYSLGCTGVLLTVSSYFSVRNVLHVDAFLICLWWKVSSTSSTLPS